MSHFELASNRSNPRLWLGNGLPWSYFFETFGKTTPAKFRYEDRYNVETGRFSHKEKIIEVDYKAELNLNGKTFITNRSLDSDDDKFLSEFYCCYLTNFNCSIFKYLEYDEDLEDYCFFGIKLIEGDRLNFSKLDLENKCQQLKKAKNALSQIDWKPPLAREFIESEPELVIFNYNN